MLTNTMKGLCCLVFLGFLLLNEGVLYTTAKQFRDVLSHGKTSSHVRYHKKLHGWSPDQNNWNEKRYPSWEEGDPRWNDCWRGGRVVARLTTDSPALVGSNVSFAVILEFPSCQKEDNDSNIIYDRNCKNDSTDFLDDYVYNWTKWIDDCGWENCTSNNTHHVFPDGRPFPHHPGWRRRNFVYLFHTLGQYYQKTAGSSATVFINTTNIALGKHLMEVLVYRRGHRTYVPVATASAPYVVTGTKTPTTTTNNTAITTNPSANLASPTSASVMEYTPDGGCHIYRYGHYKAVISILEGILEVNIIQMTSVLMSVAQATNTLVDFVVSCQGSLPTKACTTVSDPTCQVPQNMVCESVEITDECLLTIRRAFNEPGTYCVNITLGDDTSQALASTLISVNEGSSSRTAQGVLISFGFLVVFVVIVTFLLYKKYKKYKPIERSTGQAVNREVLSVYFSNFKAVLFGGSNERDPLLKSKPRIV
ncbi:transmembrane glycoprotein NMB isoform X2 [Alligator sinensis]|uniref:Transmembrane glycoprotein NMB isoform X2 n=1 Tax=Alligator sinensis TaxID=38654 RepID=A0A1U7SBJ8_ALLSI|nr:transmembrane glycoprotein NMB isoform X2 [Alligator sinensis]